MRLLFYWLRKNERLNWSWRNLILARYSCRSHMSENIYFARRHIVSKTTKIEYNGPYWQLTKGLVVILFHSFLDVRMTNQENLVKIEPNIIRNNIGSINYLAHWFYFSTQLFHFIKRRNINYLQLKVRLHSWLNVNITIH